MKKPKSLLLIVSAAMLLASCGGNSSSSSSAASSSEASASSSIAPSSSSAPTSSSSSQAPAKAAFTLGQIAHATTSLTAGEYPLNQAINFTVTAENDYQIVAVKINGQALTPTNQSYSFTPTEAKSYTLSVETQEIVNQVTFTFGAQDPLMKKGVQLDTKTRNKSKDPGIVIENGKMIMQDGLVLIILSRLQDDDQPQVWLRKITFVLSEGQNQFQPEEATEQARYANNTWADRDSTRSDNGVATLPFVAGGKVVIDKIIVETAPFEAYKTKVSFTGLDDGEKIYVTRGVDATSYETKVEYKADLEFILSETYYFLVERSDRHKKYYDLPDMRNEKDALLPYVNAQYEDPSTGQPIDLRYYQLNVPSEIIENVSLKIQWSGLPAQETFTIDTASGIQYVKGFMETDPFGSIGLQPGALTFNTPVTLFGLNSKKGYSSLKVVYNGQEIEPNEKGDYVFTVAEKDVNTLAFIASNDADDERKIQIPVSSGQGVLLGAMLENRLAIRFEPAEEHPTAALESISFQDASLNLIQDEEHGTYYMLTPEQTTAFNALAKESRPGAFACNITESGSFKSDLSFNKGAYAVKVEYSTDGVNYTVATPAGGEEDPRIAYQLDGGVQVRATFTPNQYQEMFAFEVNDRRFSDVVKDEETGIVTYNFTAKAAEYNYLIQTTAQKVTLSSTVTAGYKIEDLPTAAVNCGEKLTLKLAPADDDHSLYEKKITVTYNGQPVAVSEADFSFSIIPEKKATTIDVKVEALA